MEYVGLDKKEFEKIMQEMVIVYTTISKEKAKIYYDFFCTEKITIEELEKAKIELYRNKTSGWFPTMAEIINIILKNRTETNVYDYLDAQPIRM